MSVFRDAALFSLPNLHPLAALDLARELGVARNTVRRYLAGAEPGVRKAAVRERPVLERVQARIADFGDCFEDEFPIRVLFLSQFGRALQEFAFFLRR